MSKTTDELVAKLDTKRKEEQESKKLAQKKKEARKKAVKSFFVEQVWNGRPINWLAIALSYGAIAYTAYVLATCFVRVPEFVGIVAFAGTLIVGSRAFKK
jgi:hypothetical protein